MAKKYIKIKQIYEGKAKKLYTLKGHKDLLMQEFKDDATAFNAKKRGTILNKGKINNALTAYIFKFLERAGIRTHLVEKISDREMIIKRLKIIPIEVVTRNIAAGSLLKKTNLKEGQVLSKPIIEFYYKEDALDDPMISDSHALAMKIATEKDLNTLRKMAEKINSRLKPFFKRQGLKLVDFKLEFGKDNKGRMLKLIKNWIKTASVLTSEELTKRMLRSAAEYWEIKLETYHIRA
jgi:phosphoribosylaminoimidazole-succinocarboxamide synthase